MSCERSTTMIRRNPLSLAILIGVYSSLTHCTPPKDTIHSCRSEIHICDDKRACLVDLTNKFESWFRSARYCPAKSFSVIEPSKYPAAPKLIADICVPKRWSGSNVMVAKTRFRKQAHKTLGKLKPVSDRCTNDDQLNEAEIFLHTDRTSPVSTWANKSIGNTTIGGALICDRSISAGHAICTRKRILGAFDSFVKQAHLGSPIKFSIFVPGTSAVKATKIFDASTRPHYSPAEQLASLISARRRLQRRIRFPRKPGSAIFGALKTAEETLQGFDEKRIYILSDMREVSSVLDLRGKLPSVRKAEKKLKDAGLIPLSLTSIEGCGVGLRAKGRRDWKKTDETKKFHEQLFKAAGISNLRIRVSCENTLNI